MREVTRQLEHARRVGRWMLFAQKLFEWLGVVVAVSLSAAVIDFALRLPGWMRLVLGVAAAGFALVWIVTRVARAAAVRPELGALALHAERLYPDLAGELATGVEFSLHPEVFADADRSAALAQASVRNVEGRLEGKSLRLLNPRPTIHRLALCVLAVVAASSVVAAAPDSASTAMRRWLNPLGPAEWPRRTAVASLVRDHVWPSDTPLRVRARVEKGFRSGMRTWVTYRVVSARGASSWQSVLLNEQAPAPIAAGASGSAAGAPASSAGRRGMFERLIDLPENLLASPTPAATNSSSNGKATARPDASVEFYFEAGDDRTHPQSITLVDRPALRSSRLAIEPPAYAHGLIAPQQVDLDQQTGQIASATAMTGSNVRWSLEFNKPIPAAWLRGEGFLPGLNAALKAQGNAAAQAKIEIGDGSTEASAAEGSRIAIGFRLLQSVQSPVRLQDEYGLGNLSDRLYRVDATVDQPPAASMTLPVSDEAVLASAVIPLQAMAQDDVGVESVELQIATHAREAEPAAAGAATAPAASGGNGGATSAPRTIAHADGRSAQMSVDKTLDLAPLKLQPGDELLATAYARDVFDLDGARHEPVRSPPRRLRIIDAAALVAQIRTELGGVRQTAINLSNRQRELLDPPADKAQPGQQDVTARIDAQAGLLRSLEDRVERNRLEDPALAGLLKKASDLAEKARNDSKEADAKLGDAKKDDRKDPASPRAKARDKQGDVASGLSSLAGLLDQGRDTQAIQGELRDLIRQQDDLNTDTRATLPNTLGKSPEQLSPEDRKKLGELSDRQAALTTKADALTKQMQGAADTLSQQPDPQSKAAAEALSDAAAVAQRKGLTQTMKQAGDSAKQNKLSESSTSQQNSSDTMKEMLAQMSNQEQRQMEVLRRKLEALAEAVKKLIEQQAAQIDRLAGAKELAGLDEPQSALRRNTLSVEEQAKAEAAAAARHVGQAAEHQGTAVAALRQSQRDPASAGQKLALASLDAALKELQKAKEQTQKKEEDKNRQKLQAQYEKLAKEQDELRKQTVPFTSKPGLSRRERVDLIDLGHREADLQAAAADLGREVADTLLFRHMHGRIDKLAAQSASRLRAGQADPAVPQDQGQVSGMLRTMAGALADAQKQPDPFDKGESQSSNGGGGGGGGGAEPLIPPLAELKLLQGMQQDVLSRTRELDKPIAQTPVAPDAATPAEAREKQVIELSTQQRELSSLGERLINIMMAKQNMMREPTEVAVPKPKPAGQPRPSPPKSNQPEGR
ncbi:MAG: hypothetical protein NTW19_22910 [Planctomycetota bacterium]|nr:hypothetical protein [Planctomycetota bacterium]